MKNIYKSFALLCMGFAAAACVEESFENDKPKYDTTPGNEIVFSATAGIESGDKGKDTKTVYGDTTCTDMNKDKGWIEINWVNGDMISIASPEAVGPETAHYKVVEGGSVDDPDTEKDENKDFHSSHSVAELARLGDSGLQWSGAERYNFYGIYPSIEYDSDKTITGTGETAVPSVYGATTSLSKDGIFTGTMPIDQHYTLTGNSTSGYVASPDMRYAFMTAHNTYDPESEDPITMNFKSMVTALQFDIQPNTIDIKKDNITKMEIISVSLLSNKGISGDFRYDIKEGAEGYTNTHATRMASIHFDEAPVTLTSKGGSLNVTFFILPEEFTDAEDYLRLQIIFKLGSTQMSRIATINAKSIKGGKKYIFNNVLLPPFEEDVPASSWWDTLDPNTILPQISIPVASNVFANSAYGVEEKYQQQQMTIEQLWQMGVRGFEICTQSASTGTNFTTNMNQSLASQKFQVAENPITPTGSGAPQNFGQAFEDLYELLTREGSENECLIIVCTYMSQNDGYSPLIYVNNLFNYLTAFCQSKNITDYSTRFKQITSNVTVGEMRGKIAIIIRPGDDDRWRYQYDEASYTDPYQTLFDSVPAIDPANPIALTAEIKNRLSTSEWWDYVLMVSDWGAASFDRWDRRYGKKYASAATFNEKNVAKKTESQKLYIEDYLYGVSSTNNQTLGSPNGTYTWAGGSTNNFNGRFNETNPTSFPLPQTFDFEHSMSNGSKAYIQEWMRVVDERVRIPVAYKTNGGSQTLWVDWPSSIGEKKTAIKDLFNLSVKTQGKPLTNLYINVLTGYYVEYGDNGESRPGTFPYKDPMDGFKADVWFEILGNPIRKTQDNGDVTGHGKGGNFLRLSADLNSYVYDLLSAEPGSADGLSQAGPWGLVMLDNIQVDGVSDKLVEHIMMNNFKFDMAVKPNTKATYNATYTNGGNAISFE